MSLKTFFYLVALVSYAAFGAPDTVEGTWTLSASRSDGRCPHNRIAVLLTRNSNEVVAARIAGERGQLLYEFFAGTSRVATDNSVGYHIYKVSLSDTSLTQSHRTVRGSITASGSGALGFGGETQHKFRLRRSGQELFWRNNTRQANLNCTYTR